IILVVLTDDGGTSGGGVDTSQQSFRITILSVNDAPTFFQGPNETVFEDSGPQTIVGWAGGISTGPSNEAGQSITFMVNNDHPGLFAVQPSIDAAGGLHFTPADNANGTATVMVVLQDNGGT